MLREIPDRNGRRQVYRLARDRSTAEFLAENQIDTLAGDGLGALLVEHGYVVDEHDLLEPPFRPSRNRKPTRFSDGSFPVFYSALDSETAEAEVRHWAPTFLGGAGRRATAYYWLFRCTFEGVEKDLRPQIGTWPDLVHDSDYAFCNRLGAEAVGLGLDGLVTWSVRHAEGVNIPVLSRVSLSDPEAMRLVAITYDPATNSVLIRPAPK